MGGQEARSPDGPGAGPRTAAFGETANPAEYVPREAAEDALRELEALVRRGRTAALTAPPGLGKSLLLHILARRLAPDFACVFLPYAALTLQELCAWCLGLLGAEAPAGEDAAAAFLGEVRTRAESGEPLVLLIDDAGSMPLETARALAGLVRDSGSRFRVVVAAADDAASSRVLAALHPEIGEIRFTDPMTPEETRTYVETRLERAGVAPALRARFDPDTHGWIHRLSGGVPRRVHELANTILDEAPDGVGRDWAEERWLGAPIEGGDESDLLEDDEKPPEEPEEGAEMPGLLLDEDDPSPR